MHFKSCFFLLVLIISACSQQVYVADIDTSSERIGKWSGSDAVIDNMIEPYKTKLDAKMNEVLATSPQKMEKGRPSSTLGNWFCDILLDASRELYDDDIDFALQNYGGIRVPSLNKGDITVQNIYELMPFDNEVVLMKLDGKTTKLLLDRIAEKGGWPSSKGLTMKIEKDQAVDVLINDVPFDIKKTYHIILADYVANGGDKCFFLKDKAQSSKGVLIRDIIIDHLRKNGNSAMAISDETRIVR